LEVSELLMKKMAKRPQQIYCREISMSERDSSVPESVDAKYEYKEIL